MTRKNRILAELEEALSTKDEGGEPCTRAARASDLRLRADRFLTSYDFKVGDIVRIKNIGPNRRFQPDEPLIVLSLDVPDAESFQRQDRGNTASTERLDVLVAQVWNDHFMPFYEDSRYLEPYPEGELDETLIGGGE